MRGFRTCAFLAVVAVMLAVAPGPAQAESLGLGLAVGEPTGISLKAWLDGRHAIDAALGWSFAENASLHVHADYLWHDFGLLRPTEIKGRLPVYYGIGGRLKLQADNGDLRGRNHGDSLIGVRFPLGVAWIAHAAPVDVFFEIAPVLDLVPASVLSLNGMIGVRYWLR